MAEEGVIENYKQYLDRVNHFKVESKTKVSELEKEME